MCYCNAAKYDQMQPCSIIDGVWPNHEIRNMHDDNSMNLFKNKIFQNQLDLFNMKNQYNLDLNSAKEANPNEDIFKENYRSNFLKI